MTWIPLLPDDDDYTVQPGGLYRAVVSLSKNFSAAQVRDYLQGHDWQLVNLWEMGEQLPKDWPPVGSFPAPEDNHREIFAQGLFQGEESKTIGVTPPWPFSIYRIDYVWRWKEPDAPAPTPPKPEPAHEDGSTWPFWAAVGGVAGVGLWLMHRALKRA